MMPAQRLSLDVLGGYSTLSGPMAEINASLRVTQNLAVWAGAQWTQAEARALAGVRLGW